MDGIYAEVPLSKIKLDVSNPRIASIIEKYGDRVSAEAISLALGSGGSDEPNSTSFDALKESIRIYGGVINPVVLNKKTDDEYIVIEGNTRVQIYNDFLKEGASGNWEKIKAIVYDNLPDEQIHSIRLQAHLVGPRSWKPYAKAKYVASLYHEQELSLNQIISYCGGSKTEILRMIQAYDDMEENYRPNLSDDDIFDESKYSYFDELEKSAIKALIANGYDRNDYAKWVINGNVDTATSTRKLGKILTNDEARKEFLKTNATEAIKCLTIQDANSSVKDASLMALVTALSQKIAVLPYTMILKMIEEDSEEYDALSNVQYDLNQILSIVDAKRNSVD